MSGIFGIYHLDGRPACRDELGQMHLTLAHRGSDSIGSWSDGAIALGNRLMWTTPESLQEHLPMTSLDGDIVITADARIDNRDEVIADLGLTGSSSASIPDSALIIAAYKKWHYKCPERFLGDFAFVIWDRQQRILFCVRDYFGVKPFYYYYEPNKRFAFASEIKGLLCLPGVSRPLNERRLGDYLQGICGDKTSTFYKNILRLPPAHSAIINASGITQNCYWSLDPSSELHLGSAEEYAAAYRETFTRAVRARLRSAFPLGSQLSGGLDSSSITCVARDLLASEGRPRLDTYSIIFDKVPESDERFYINAVVEQGGVNPNYIHGDIVTPLTDITRALWHQDEPFPGPNLFLNWEVWNTARRGGIRVLLDGMVGDSVVSHGFAYLSDLARSWRLIRLAREIKILSRRYKVPHGQLVRRYIWDDGIGSLSPIWFQRLMGLLSDDRHVGLSTVINQGFARRLGVNERPKHLAESQKRKMRSAREEHYEELCSPIIPAGLEIASHGAAAFNIEVRFPFLDRRLVELCLAIPPQQKIQNGLSRAIARRALRSTLPAKVCSRSSKGNMGPNFIRGLRSDETKLQKLLFHGPKSLLRYIDLSALEQRYKALIANVAMTEADVLAMFFVALLSSWLRISESI